jgi:HlyD family secretion protein
MQTLIKKAVIMIIVSAAAAAVGGRYLTPGRQRAAAYRTARVTRGNLLVAISATGTVEPEEVIDVGAQIAGQILSFGRDADGQSVDYGSKVSANRKAVDLATTLYAQGYAEFLNVLDAQRSLYASEDALVQSTGRVSTNLVALFKALGGGWRETEDAKAAGQPDLKDLPVQAAGDFHGT